MVAACWLVSIALNSFIKRSNKATLSRHAAEYYRALALLAGYNFDAYLSDMLLASKQKVF